MKRPFIPCFPTYCFMVSLDLTRLPVLMVSECIPNCGFLVYKVPREEEKESHSSCLHRKLCLQGQKKKELKLKGNIKRTNSHPLLLKFLKQIFPWCRCFKKVLAPRRWKIALKLPLQLSFPSVGIDTPLIKVGPCWSNLGTEVQMCQWSHGEGRDPRGDPCSR